MKRALLLLAACVTASSASAMPRSRAGVRSYIQAVPPYYVNIFGPNRSGVAPSTAAPERGPPVYAAPAFGGAHTGGVKD